MLVLIAALAVVSAVAATLAGRLPLVAEPPSGPVLLGLLLALVVAGSLNLEYSVRGQTDAFDHFEVALVPTLFFLPPLLAVLITLAAKAITQISRRVAPVKASFNVAQWACAAGVGALVFAGLLARWPHLPKMAAVVGAMVAVVAVNATAVLCVLALVQRRSPRRWVPRHAASLLGSTAGTALVNVTFGLLFVATAQSSPGATPLLLVPLALLHWAGRGYAIGRVEQSRLRTTRAATSALAAGLESADGSAFHERLAEFLAVVGAGLDRGRVDLLLPMPDGAEVEVLRWRRGEPTEPADCIPVDQLSGLHQSLLGLPEPIRLFASGGDRRSTLLAEAGWRDCVAAPVRTGPGQVGALALYGARSPVALPERELEIVGELGREAGAAVERATLLQAVLEERAKMSQIVNETGDGIVTLGADGIVRTWNRALERLTGYPADELVGTRGLSRLRPVDAHASAVDFAGWASAAQDPPQEVLVTVRTGERHWLSCSYARGQDERGRPDRLIMLVRDVSALKRSEAVLAGHTAVLELIASGAQLRHSLQFLAEALARLTDGPGCVILLTDPADAARLCVGGAAGVAEDVLRELGGRDGGGTGWLDGVLLRQRPVLVADLEAPGPLEELRMAARRLGIRSMAALPIRAPSGDRVVGVLTLLSDRPRPHELDADRALLERAAGLAAVAVARSEFEEQLAHQATHDALTGLPNRAAFLDRCERALRARRLGPAPVVFFVDLDRFKVVNDKLGHEAGDQLLVGVAERLERIVRPGDTVARFGGDELTILCEGSAEPLLVSELANRILGIFDRPFPLAGSESFMTASVGVAVGTTAVTAGDLVNNADVAMYRAKERGGNCFELYDRTMRPSSSLPMVTHNALHRALAGGELVVMYQPMVSLTSGQLIGVEALLRWQHPERGLLLPQAFLPFAERTGLIGPIGAHVVSVACEQARKWERAGPQGTPLQMNINLSARELGEPGLTTTVADALAASGTGPASICFEITESALLHDVEATTANLRNLKDLGVALAIDDFGTGYASLTYLRRFPVDALKVDRSFVSGLSHDADDRAIVTAVISLARSLRLHTIAEGVETVGQLSALQELGCEAAQGYYLAPPGLAERMFEDAH